MTKAQNQKIIENILTKLNSPNKGKHKIINHFH